MLEFTRYAVERRLRGAFVLSGLLAALAGFTAAFFPSVKTSAAELEQYIESLPPAFREAFGIETFATIEGFLATEFYTFGWLLLLGLYFAYRAGALLSSDVESGRIDIVLAMPISRARLVGERFLALVPTMLVVNVVGAAAVQVAVIAVGESISPSRLLAVHALSIPYFLACAGIGLVLSAITDSRDRAARGALGLVFGLFILESLTAAADADWAGLLSPTRYYGPSAILVRGDVDLVGALVLLLAGVGLVAIAAWSFTRRDIE